MLPGRTEVAKQPTDALVPFKSIASIPPLFHRRVILIATQNIDNGNLFSNGLFQNVYLIYRLCEAIGWLPIMLFGRKPNLEETPTVLRNCRVATIEDIDKAPIPVGVYLEIGMSIPKELRNSIKEALGAKTCKLYLGNILNIDIEMPIFYFPQNMAHHSLGCYDEIWFSPHYLMHAQYGAALNHIEPGSSKQRIAPYVWDPSILLDDGRRQLQWKPPTVGEKQRVIIMEPNISFQKCSLIPIMIMEAYCSKHPEWDGEVVIVNGEKLLHSTYFLPSIYQHLDIVKQDKLKLCGRQEVKDLMANYPSFIPICHNVNNDFNYMGLEFMYTGFPLIHNSISWKDFGYYYEENNIAQAVQLLEDIMAYHTQRLETYKTHGRILAWRYSLYNPDVQRGWKELLESSTA